jgi:hypothetical protein
MSSIDRRLRRVAVVVVVALSFMPLFAPSAINAQARKRIAIVPF